MKFTVRSDAPDIPIKGAASVVLYPSVNQTTVFLKRSRLSTRHVIAREANRRGLLVGVLSRAGTPITQGEAFHAAVDSMHGIDRFGNVSVPDRWRDLFVRVFIKAATYAAHTDRPVTTRGSR